MSDSNVNNNFTLNGKLSNGSFISKTIDGVSFVNNDSQFYCTNEYGCYYNWYTTTAGSGSSTTPTNTDVGYSICPLAWVLPSNAQYTSLIGEYDGASALLVNPSSSSDNPNGGSLPGFILSGAYSTSGNTVRTYSEYYTSSSYANRSYAYVVRINGSSVTQSEGTKYVGRTIRCLLSES